MEEFYKDAYKKVDFEFDTNRKEVEIYIAGWFLASVSIKDISKEAKEELFKTESAK